MNWYKTEAEKRGRVFNAFKAVFTAEVMDEVARCRESMRFELRYCQVCNDDTQHEWLWGEHGEELKCLQCGINLLT